MTPRRLTSKMVYSYKHEKLAGDFFRALGGGNSVFRRILSGPRWFYHFTSFITASVREWTRSFA